jgi:hypothetical protein
LVPPPNPRGELDDGDRAHVARNIGHQIVHSKRDEGASSASSCSRPRSSRPSRSSSLMFPIAGRSISRVRRSA